MLVSLGFYFRPQPAQDGVVTLKSATHPDSFVSIDRINPKTQVFKQSIVVIPPSTEKTQDSYRIQRDSFSVKMSKEIESKWEDEMYQHLLYLDEEQADKIIANYHAFMNAEYKSLENDLTFGIKQLSDLNGQSGEVESMYAAEEKSEQDRKEELKQILSPHYEFLEGARRDFLSNNN